MVSKLTKPSEATSALTMLQLECNNAIRTTDEASQRNYVLKMFEKVQVRGD